MAKGLPKSIIAKYGISKKAWDVYRGRKSPSKKVKTLVRHKRYRRVRRAYARVRRHTPKAYPISVIAPLAGHIFTAPKEGWETVYQAVQQRDFYKVAKIEMQGWTGIDIETGELALPKYLLLLGLGCLVHKGASAVGINRQLSKLPGFLKKIAV